jgi:hypothetical protein
MRIVVLSGDLGTAATGQAIVEIVQSDAATASAAADQMRY